MNHQRDNTAGQWRGLHNHDRHEPLVPLRDTPLRAWCECGSACLPGWECQCCLTTEVERMTDELANRDQRIAETLRLHWPRHDAFDDRIIYCGFCNEPMPCRTVQILKGESDELYEVREGVK